MNLKFHSIDNAKKTLAYNIMNLFIIQGVNYLLPFIALPFLYRTLGTTTYGIIATAYSFYIFCDIVIDFGYGYYSTREISLNVNDKTVINKISTTTLCAKCLITIVVLLISFGIVQSVPNYRNYSIIFYLMAGIPIGNCFFPIWYFQGIERMGYITTTTTLAKFLTFMPIFFFVDNSEDAPLVAVFYSIGFIISGIVSVIILYVKFGVRIVRISFSDILFSIKGSFPYFLSRVSASSYGLGNTMVLTAFCGSQFAGYYDVAQKILSVITQMVSPISQALYPYMIKGRNTLFFKRLLKFGFWAGVSLFLLMIFLAEPIMHILFNEYGEITINTYRILSLCILFVIPSYLMGYPLLAALGHVKYTNNTVMLAAVFYIVCLLVLIFTNNINIYSLALLYVFAEFSVCVMRIFGIKKYKTFN